MRPPSPPPGFVHFQHEATRAWLRADLAPHAALLGLTGAPAPALRTLRGGREPHPVVELPGGVRVVLRRYRRGGAMRHLNPARYFLGHRAWDELRATEAARRAGARVPEVIAAAERRALPGYTAMLATRLVEDATELASWLEDHDAEGRRAVLEDAGGQIGLLHRGGVAHPDLNLRNFLVAPSPGGPVTYVLDFDRARLYPGPVPPRRRARDLRRLARSARKVSAPLGPAEWSALRRGYGASWPLPADLG